MNSKIYNSLSIYRNFVHAIFFCLLYSFTREMLFDANYFPVEALYKFFFFKYKPKSALKWIMQEIIRNCAVKSCAFFRFAIVRKKSALWKLKGMDPNFFVISIWIEGFFRHFFPFLFFFSNFYSYSTITPIILAYIYGIQCKHWNFLTLSQICMSTI